MANYETFTKTKTKVNVPNELTDSRSLQMQPFGVRCKVSGRKDVPVVGETPQFRLQAAADAHAWYHRSHI